MCKRNERVLDVVEYFERNLARGVPADEEEEIEPEERPVVESEIAEILAEGREQSAAREERERRRRLEAERCERVRQRGEAERPE